MRNRLYILYPRDNLIFIQPQLFCQKFDGVDLIQIIGAKEEEKNFTLSFL